MTQTEAVPIDPTAPHDDLSFEELATRYNFNLTSDRRRMLARLIARECKRIGDATVLDVGCGRGIGRDRGVQYAIKDHVSQYWGIEPDAGIQPAEGLFDKFQHALMETADLPENSVDLAYSFMVMEHVADPGAFFAALARCLKPGGVYIFMTVNARHYFTRMAHTMNKLRVDEWALRKLRGDQTDEYHYPTQYKVNTERQIRDVASHQGFAPPKFAYLESYGPTGYTPGPLKLLVTAGRLKRKVLKNPTNLLTLTVRMQKAED